MRASSADRGAGLAGTANGAVLAHPSRRERRCAPQWRRPAHLRAGVPGASCMPAVCGKGTPAEHICMYCAYIRAAAPTPLDSSVCRGWMDGWTDGRMDGLGWWHLPTLPPASALATGYLDMQLPRVPSAMRAGGGSSRVCPACRAKRRTRPIRPPRKKSKSPSRKSVRPAERRRSSPSAPSARPLDAPIPRSRRARTPRFELPAASMLLRDGGTRAAVVRKLGGGGADFPVVSARRAREAPPPNTDRLRLCAPACPADSGSSSSERRRRRRRGGSTCFLFSTRRLFQAVKNKNNNKIIIIIIKTPVHLFILVDGPTARTTNVPTYIHMYLPTLYVLSRRLVSVSAASCPPVC